MMDCGDFSEQSEAMKKYVLSSNDYIAEEKYDGGRFELVIENGNATLYSHDDNARNGSFLKIANFINCVLDGELFVPGGQSKDLVHCLASEKEKIKYCVFDVLELNGKNLTSLPLQERRKILVKVILELRSPIMFAPEWFCDLELMFNRIVGRGGEGIVIKHKGAPYLDRKSTRLNSSHTT
jgi:ATP-dependent DNA ligase